MWQDFFTAKKKEVNYRETEAKQKEEKNMEKRVSCKGAAA